MVVVVSDASAYKLDRSLVPQPVLRYYVSVPDWEASLRRVVKALNRADVGVRLVRAKIPERASIQVGRLKGRCGRHGVLGTTQTIQGGFSAIYLPRGCPPVNASIIAAHELGHALGLLHEDRRCALMNSSGTGSKSIPTRCLGRNYDWLRRPFRKDDLAGLRKQFRNTAPTAVLGRAEPDRPAVVNRPVTFTVSVSDRENNLSEVELDFGDGSVSTGYAVEDLQTSHSYTAAGSYTVTLSAIDLYGRRTVSTVTVTVAAA